MPARGHTNIGRAGVNVLAFDCAGRGCSVAVTLGSRVAAVRVEAMERGQAEALMPMIEAVLAEAATELGMLDLIAVATGPGSFTGLRIALAAARGLALATGLPAVGVTSFAAVAAGVPSDPRGRPLAVVLDSKRSDFFVQCFAASGEPLAEGCAVAPDAAETVLPPGEIRLAGDAARRLQPFAGMRASVVERTGLADPAAIARLAAQSLATGRRPPLPRPLYLRAPDTTLPRRRAGAP